MREVAFIRQNKNRWQNFESALASDHSSDPDATAQLYIQLVTDLSYAQTYYPKSNTTRYLNFLASQIFQKIYQTKRQETNRISYFFKTEVPLIVHGHMRYIAFSFLIFALFTSIGVISAAYDQDFVRLILGDDYVNMTIDNIKKGDPTGVYASGSNWGSFIGITWNNLRVGLGSFVYGIFGGFGTLFFLFQNCLMLGSFQYFFHEQNSLLDSARAIWIHGCMEIFSMIIEAASGFILGASVLFPATYSRINSLKIGFRNSFKIVVSTMPFTFFAGVLEGFVTRYAQQMPIILNCIIIFGTLGLITWYYLIYPFQVKRKSTLNFYNQALTN